MSIIISPVATPADTSSDAALALRLQREELGPARNSHPSQPPRPNLPRVRGPEWLVPTNPLYYLFWRSGIHREPVLFIIMAPQVYALGMVGYAFAVVVRVIEVASAVIAFLNHLLSFVFCCGRRVTAGELWKTTTNLIGRIAELISGVIGLACPLIAYVCDEFIYKSESFRPEHSWDAHVRNATQKYLDNGEKARNEMAYEFRIFQRAATLLVKELNSKRANGDAEITVGDLEIGINEEQFKLTRIAFMILLMEKKADPKNPGLGNIRKTLTDKIEAERRENERRTVKVNTPIDLTNFDTQTALVESYLSTYTEDPNALLSTITKSIANDENSVVISALKQTEQIFTTANRNIWAGLIRVHIGAKSSWLCCY